MLKRSLDARPVKKMTNVEAPMRARFGSDSSGSDFFGLKLISNVNRLFSFGATKNQSSPSAKRQV
jgi:hypothetical protein